MNEVQEQHARQALKDIWDGAKQFKDVAYPKANETEEWLGSLMAKVSTVLEYDFDEKYPGGS